MLVMPLPLHPSNVHGTKHMHGGVLVAESEWVWVWAWMFASSIENCSTMGSFSEVCVCFSFSWVFSTERQTSTACAWHGMGKLLCEVGCLTFVEISLSYKDTVSLSPGCRSVHSVGSYFLCSCSLVCALSKYIFMITIRHLKWDFVMLAFIDCRSVF